MAIIQVTAWPNERFKPYGAFNLNSSLSEMVADKVKQDTLAFCVNPRCSLKGTKYQLKSGTGTLVDSPRGRTDCPHCENGLFWTCVYELT